MKMKFDPHRQMELLREAAKLGPGHRGERIASTFSRRTTLADELTEAGLDAPPYLKQESEWVERRAKLFEAGDYPDKGVNVDVTHLNALATAFDLPVPILIEHAESPLEIGYLTQVEHVGNELFGTLSLTTEANDLVERSGSKSLSLGLAPDLTEIREVSLVRNPRVASAQLFSAGVRFDSTIELHGSGVNWQRKYDQLLRERRSEEAGRQVTSFVAEGKLTPAQAPLATALLASDEGVQFDGETQPLAGLLLRLLQSQPSHKMFGERAPVPPAQDYSQHLMMPEEVAFYQKHFPGISLDEIAKRR